MAFHVNTVIFFNSVLPLQLWFLINKFQPHTKDRYYYHFLPDFRQVNATRSQWWFVIDWSHQARSHYLNKCWSHFMWRHMMSLGNNEFNYHSTIILSITEWIRSEKNDAYDTFAHKEPNNNLSSYLILFDLKFLSNNFINHRWFWDSIYPH